MERLTVIVPCKDERKNIAACIASFADLADEIIIADSGSTDGTIQLATRICSRLDCSFQLIEREYRTSGDFKNWAIPQASHNWILLVDADERITVELADEIRETLKNPERDGYWIFRDNHFMGHLIRHGGYNHDKVLRLFRRDVGRYNGPSDHGEVSISTGSVGTLESRMLHYSFWSYDQLFAKFKRYTTVQSDQWFKEGRKTSFFQLLFRPMTRFIRDYFLLLGILDGKIGLQLSLLAAFYTFTKQARLWTHHQGLTQPQVESAYADRIAGNEHLASFGEIESILDDEITEETCRQELMVS